MFKSESSQNKTLTTHQSVKSILLRGQIFMTISKSNDILHAFWVFIGSEICCKHTGISDLPKTSWEHACHILLWSVPAIVNLSWFRLVWSRIYILVLSSCLSLDLPNGVFPQGYPTHLILDHVYNIGWRVKFCNSSLRKSSELCGWMGLYMAV